MKLNLGCGLQRMDGFVNVDRESVCNPDRVVDLETLPWPFEDSSATAVVMSHVLEHLGASSTLFMGIIKELYRVCAHNAQVNIILPHPRHDQFLVDPTHVRALLPQAFMMFSKRQCEEWARTNAANSPLALFLGVDFETEKVKVDLDPHWLQKVQSGEISHEGVEQASQQYNNVIEQFEVILRVVKA